jgi:hypothetical protein
MKSSERHQPISEENKESNVAAQQLASNGRNQNNENVSSIMKTGSGEKREAEASGK